MADLRIDIASEFVGAKAFKQADTATSALSKQVTRLAKSYLGLVGAQKLARSSFNVVKEFAADDKAARVLSRSLDNLGLAFADPSVRSFIAELEKTFGVLDDQLRPAFQRLLTTTGDVTKSQSLLLTALNLSAASGVDVVTVAGDLSKGYVGQTRALAKYGLGLTQAQLKAMSFEEVQTRINTLFGGQAQLSADSYSGSLDRLSIAGTNAKEVLGKGLTEALANLGGGGKGGFANTIKLIEMTSTALGDLIRKLGLALGVTGQLFTGDLSGAKALIAAEANRNRTGGGIIPSIAAEIKKAAAAKAALKTQTALTKTTQAQTKAIKEQTALQKAGTLFDLEQTQVIAALKGNISADERKRLELQLALLTGNTTEASILAGKLAYSQGLTKELVAYFKNLPDAKNPFAGWAAYLDAIEAQVKRIAVGGTTGGGTAAVTGTSMSNGNGMFDPSDFLPQIPGGKLGAGFNQPGTVIVNVAGSVVSEGELVDAVRNGLINSSLSGAGSLVARRTGTFATL
jgi:hypothetical protein